MKPFVKVPYYVNYPGVHDAPVCKGVLNMPPELIYAFQQRGHIVFAEEPKVSLAAFNEDTNPAPVSYKQYLYRLMWVDRTMPYIIFTDPKALRTFKRYLQKLAPARVPRCPRKAYYPTAFNTRKRT